MAPDCGAWRCFFEQRHDLVVLGTAQLPSGSETTDNPACRFDRPISPIILKLSWTGLEGGSPTELSKNTSLFLFSDFGLFVYDRACFTSRGTYDADNSLHRTTFPLPGVGNGEARRIGIGG